MYVSHVHWPGLVPTQIPASNSGEKTAWQPSASPLTSLLWACFIKKYRMFYAIISSDILFKLASHGSPVPSCDYFSLASEAGDSYVDLTPGWQESNYFLLRGVLIILMVLILSVLGFYPWFCDHLSAKLPRCPCCQVTVEGNLELSLLLSQWSAYSPKPRSPLVSRAAG